MRRRAKTAVTLVMLATLPIVVAFSVLAAATARAGLEGRWRLVEQRFGEGQANQASGAAPLWLEFAPDGARLAGRVWIADPTPRALVWPGPPDGRAAGPMTIEQRSIDATTGRALARYTMPPAAPGGETLSVIEEYALSQDGASLTGTVTVSLAQDGEERGHYVLHRRFERQP